VKSKIIAEGLVQGDTFLFAGEILRFEGLDASGVIVSRAPRVTDPKIPAYAGGKISTVDISGCARPCFDRRAIPVEHMPRKFANGSHGKKTNRFYRKKMNC